MPDRPDLGIGETVEIMNHVRAGRKTSSLFEQDVFILQSLPTNGRISADIAGVKIAMTGPYCQAQVSYGSRSVNPVGIVSAHLNMRETACAIISKPSGRE